MNNDYNTVPRKKECQNIIFTTILCCFDLLEYASATIVILRTWDNAETMIAQIVERNQIFFIHHFHILRERRLPYFHG